MRRNPGFDGKVENKIEHGVVTEIKVVPDKVTDISPIRVLNRQACATFADTTQKSCQPFSEFRGARS